MVTNDHPGQKKIQCWIPQELWDKIEALNIPNQTSAVTEAFRALLDKSQNIPNESQDIPRLEATIQGLQLLLQEKDERISDLKRETETLSTFAHYFKSLEYRRIEASTEEKEIVSQAREEKPAREPRRAQAVKGEKEIIRRNCRNCGAEFEAVNPKQVYCKNSCKTAFNRRK